MKHFGTVLLSCIILSGCCSCNDRCFTNAYVLGESLDIVVRNGVIMQCYTSGSKENSACKNVEVTDCAGNLLVPTSNVKTLLESFTLEGKERFALSDIQGSMEKGVPADFLLINANGKDLDKGMFGRRDVLEAFIGGRSVFKKKVVKFRNRSRDAETLEETVCHSVHTSIYDISNKVLVISTQESGRGHTLPL